MKPASTDEAVNGRTSSSASVSGRRLATHQVTMMPATAMKAKIRCQLPKNRTTWPVPGAMIGTIMKTIMMSDMTSAMARPP